MAAKLAALLLAAGGIGAAATLGFDVAGAISPTLAKCIVQQGYSFAVIRAWHSYGAFDTDAPGTMASLWAAGIAHADVYLFPCPTLNAAAQVKQLLGNLTAHDVKYGMVWLDIEQDPSTGCAWPTDQAVGCAFLQQLGAALTAAGVNWGTYATPWEWENTVGTACRAGTDHPVWYANPDGQDNFNDWVAFGGWTTPAVKQWDWSATPCGLNVDSDWYPDSAPAPTNATGALRGTSASGLSANWWAEYHTAGYRRFEDEQARKHAVQGASAKAGKAGKRGGAGGKRVRA